MEFSTSLWARSNNWTLFSRQDLAHHNTFQSQDYSNICCYKIRHLNLEGFMHFPSVFLSPEKSWITRALSHRGVRGRFLPLGIRFQLFFITILWLLGFSIGEKSQLLSDSGQWIHPNTDKEGNALQRCWDMSRDKGKASREKKRWKVDMNWDKHCII